MCVLLFENSAKTKYMLSERSSDDENIKHSKNALQTGCKKDVYT